MTREHWHRLQDLFLAAAELPPVERRAFLEAQCGDDTALFAEVDRMLRHDAAVPLGQAELMNFAAQAFAEEQDPYLGHTFGLYQFKSRLAVGGMSWVYLAERPDQGRDVAVKVLRDVMSPSRRQLFNYETRLLAQMNHPSIARLYDAGTLDDGAAFFVMEYVDGLQITEYARQHELKLGERLALFRQVCDAVRYAHARGVIHRDLKPSNILVQAGGVVKLLDFGVSGQAGSAGETAPSSSYMTLAYAAPEQIRHEPAEVQADVYSLGVILQQLLTGQLPFEFDRKPTDVVRAIVLTQAPRAPSDVIHTRMTARAADPTKEDGSGLALGIDADALSPIDWVDVDHICGKALAKEPNKRYGSVESLARDLDLFEQKQPLEDFRPSRRYVTRRFLQRNHRAVLLAASAIACIAALIGFYTYRLAKARNAAVAEAARTDRVEKFMEQLLTGGDPDNGPAFDLRVVTILGRGVQDAQALSSDQPIQATLYALLGGLYGTMGSFDQAEPLFRSAVEEQSKLYGANSAQVASTLARWSLVREHEGKPGEGEAMARRALNIDAQKLSPYSSQAVNANITLGSILTDRGAYGEAVPLLRDAVARASSKDPETYDLSTALSNLADADFYLGNLQEASGLYSRALALDRQLKGEDNIDTAEDLMSVSAVDERLGRLPQAEAGERRALAIEQHWYQNADQPAIAGALTKLAQTLTNEERPKEALPVAEEALAMRQRLHEPADAGFAHTWNALAHVHRRLNDFQAAERDNLEALAMYRQILPGPSYQTGVSLDNLSNVDFKLHQYVKASQYSDDAVRMLKATLPGDDPMIATAEGHYGRALEAQNRLNEAEAQYLAAYPILLRHRTEGQDENVKVLRGYLAALYRKKHQPDKASLYEH